MSTIASTNTQAAVQSSRLPATRHRLLQTFILIVQRRHDWKSKLTLQQVLLVLDYVAPYWKPALFSIFTWTSSTVTPVSLVIPIPLANVVVGFQPAELRQVTSSSMLATFLRDNPMVSGTVKRFSNAIVEARGRRIYQEDCFLFSLVSVTGENKIVMLEKDLGVSGKLNRLYKSVDMVDPTGCYLGIM